MLGRAALLALLCLGARADLGAHPLRSALTSFVHEASAVAATDLRQQRRNPQRVSVPSVKAYRSPPHQSQPPERAAQPDRVEAEEEAITWRVAQQVAAQRRRRRGTAAGTPRTDAEIHKLDSMLHLVDSQLAMKRLRHEQGQTASNTQASVASAQAVAPSEPPVLVREPVVATPEPAVAQGHVRVGIPPGTASGQMMQVVLPGVDTPVRFKVPQMAPGDECWLAE